MQERIIFHIDMNHCYAQIEEMMHPKLRDVPMAVGGHEEKRHGIILTRNDLAGREGIRTGESLREAYEKDPDLLVVPPHYDAYVYYTEAAKDIYRQYSSQVEPFGLDEAWIDFTESMHLYGDPLSAAREIQQRIYEELGLSVSLGISWNKAFAKLGSDMAKPFGFTCISHQNYRKRVWPLPCEDLIYVGPAARRKLHERGILTIGDLAEYPVILLKKTMGICGEMIHAFANGRDPSPVSSSGAVMPHSIGNSMTLIHDVSSREEIRPVYYVLCEAAASRMRDAGAEGNLISVSLRTAGMDWYGCERKIPQKTNVSGEILEEVMHLMQGYDFSVPVRAAGVSVGNLSEAGHSRQLNLFRDEESHEKAERMDTAMNEIRGQYGFYAVRRACTMLDRPLTEFNVKQDHTVHPVGYFQGRKMVIA